MPRPIDDRVRKTIFAMMDAGASTRAIAEATGVSGATVRRMRAQRQPAKALKSAQPSLNPRTHTRDGEALKSAQPAQPIERMPISDNRAFQGMVGLIDPLLDQFHACTSIATQGERAYVMNMYANTLVKIYSKIGTWTGLDDPAPIVATVSPLDDFARSLEAYETAEQMKEGMDAVGTHRA